MFQKIKALAIAHKFATGLIIVLLIGGAYKGYSSLNAPSTELRYILAAVEKGTIASSVSGSGQVSVSQQLDMKAKVSGDVLEVRGKKGQDVKAGTVLVQIDAKDAQKSVRDAEINLESAKIALKKFKQPTDKLTMVQTENALAQAKRELAALQTPPDALELLQAQNALESAEQSKQKAKDDLEKGYENEFNEVANSFLDLPAIVTGLNDIFFGKTIVTSKANIDWYVDQAFAEDTDKTVKYRNDLSEAYTIAVDHLTKNAALFQASSRTSGIAATEALVEETYQTTILVADAAKSANDYVDFIQASLSKRNASVPAVMATHQTTLDSYSSKANTRIGNLLAAKRSIGEYKNAVLNADKTIAEKTEALEKLKKGADEDTIQTAKEKIREREESLKKLKVGPEALDLKSQELTVRQRANALSDAKEKLADYAVRAPFDGILASVDVKSKDTLSSGAAIATLMTKQRIAEISLNEVDVAKVQPGQKVTLTFDAVADLTITGAVADLDALGTVTQGVVTYSVKIIFDTQDERVKPGMSVSAAIITDLKQDVLMVPNSAVKLQGDTSYVEIFDAPLPPEQFNNTQGILAPMPPHQQFIDVGISNDTSTEVTSGLQEGDQVITKTITAAAKAATTQTPSLFGTGNRGGGSATGGAFRIPR